MGLTLKQARLLAGLTQLEAADKIGVAPNTIRRWEIGETSPNFKHVPKICETYNVSSYEDIIFLSNNNA